MNENKDTKPLINVNPLSPVIDSLIPILAIGESINLMKRIIDENSESCCGKCSECFKVGSCDHCDPDHY